MVWTPCCLACCSMAAPEALSRFTIARTVTPPVTICWAIVCIFCASPPAFWMSNSTPASLKAASSFGRSWLSHRGEEVVSGRMTPTLPEASPPPPLLLLLLDESDPPPQAARAKTAVAARADVVRVRRRTLRGALPFRWGCREIPPHILAWTRLRPQPHFAPGCRTVTSALALDESAGLALWLPAGNLS